ncbi:MAG: CxxxxCH/CxxCH domain-containing protein [Desulfuromonadaceae bacterium]|nr:CxxxxCH/CxxCH domain-containing protein [Desulfuromonadaceae bacterium]MDD2856659.1 CxxxxCH/CxxCH domain-containing protein [Desulfuromonadaceae bacterium]
MNIQARFYFLIHKIILLTVITWFALANTNVAEAAPQYSMICSSCHQMPPLDSANEKKNPANGAVPGNHQNHAGSAASSCAKCHGTGANDVLAYDTSHRNRIIELSDTLGYGRKTAGVFMNQTSVPPNPLGTCSAAVCHSNGKGVLRTTPAWGSLAPADCNTCHDATPSTASHNKHIAGYGYGCIQCHTDHTVEARPFQHATSAGRNIDVHFSAPSNSSGTFAANQCSNIYCHSNGQAGGANVTATPSWGGSATCADCHGTAATAASLSGKHASHVNNAAVLGTNYGCVECHSATVSDNSTISDVTKHVNGTIDVAGTKVGSVTVTTGPTCASSSCHWDGKSVQRPVTWTQATSLGCNGCHGTGNAFGAPDYANGGAGLANANSHAKHATAADTCVNCHSRTTNTGLAIIAGSQHTNGFINYTSGNGKTFGKQANKTCSDISCHSGNGIVVNVPSAQWGATLDCAGCHNIPTSSVGGSHTQHLSKAGITCEDCHTATASGSTGIKAGAPHVNNSINVGGGIVSTFNADKTCATVCHNGTSPVWGNPGGVTVCGTCHSVGPPFATNFSQYYTGDQALHNVHFGGTYGPNITIGATANGCATCHAFTDILSANHDNQTINLDGTKVTNITVGSLNLAIGNSGLTAQCSTCHNQSTEWKNSAAAGGSRLVCESCHNSGSPSVINGKSAPDKPFASTSGHGMAGIAQACTACHNNNSQHIGVVGGTKRLFDVYSSTTAGAGCNSCHSDSGIVTTASKQNMRVHQASGLGSRCSDCHDPHGTSNAKMVSSIINGTAVSYSGTSTFANAGQTGVCQTCHTTTQYFTKAGITPPQTHMDSTTNCLTCHLHNPTNGDRAFTAPGNCDACHGYPPAPRNVAGLEFGLQGKWSSARFEDYSGGGGAHIVGAHIPATAKASDGWANCTPCHKGGASRHAKVLPIRNHVENITVSVDQQLRFSNDVFAIYTTAKLLSAGANRSGSCFNVSCHFATTLKWSTER